MASSKVPSHVTGLDNVLRNLNETIVRMRKRTVVGLIDAAKIVLDDTDKTPPLIPVDYGNLRHSRFIVSSLGNSYRNFYTFVGPQAEKIQEGHQETIAEAMEDVAQNSTEKFPLVVFGFSAFYHEWVHEMVGANFQRANSGAKYLEASMKRNKRKMIEAIRKEVRLKK